MKKIVLFAGLLSAPFFMNAQCSATTSSTPVTCFNACDGTATVTPTSGNPPYTYLWGPGGQTTQSVTGLCAGTYSITVIDQDGCNVSQTVLITQPTQIFASYSMQAATCSTCCDGYATAIITGGVPPYSFSWFPSGNTTATDTALCPGTYSFTVTDSTGCTIGGPIITIANSAGVQDPNVIGAISVFPIPANQQVNVEVNFANPAYAEISITNVLGEVIYVKALGSAIKLNEKIDLSALPAGIYLISVITNTGTSIKRIIKE